MKWLVVGAYACPMRRWVLGQVVLCSTVLLASPPPVNSTIDSCFQSRLEYSRCASQLLLQTLG